MPGGEGTPAVAGVNSSFLRPVLRALRFHDADPAALSVYPARVWPRILNETDAAHLTLALGIRCREFLPPSARERVDQNLRDNLERQRRLWTTYREIAAALGDCDTEFVVLKGAAHWPYFCESPFHRPQYDFDLWIDSRRVNAARAIAGELGFAPVPGRRDGPSDHLPTMIRRTGWRWRGDYYDPEMPPSLELHLRLWDPVTEQIEVSGLDSFWRRREVRDVAGCSIPVLSLPDTLSYAALHVLRHLLRGDLRAYHVYELAHFLEHSSEDAAFWNTWADVNDSAFRILQGVAFQLAREWFHCRAHSFAEEAVKNPPPSVRNWFRRFAYSPLQERPNKDELLLHLGLIADARGRRRILSRRLFPHPAVATHDPHVPAKSPLRNVSQFFYRARFLWLRLVHHTRALAGSAGALFPVLVERDFRPSAGTASCRKSKISR